MLLCAVSLLTSCASRPQSRPAAIPGDKLLLAVLPVDDLCGAGKARASEVRAALVERLGKAGVTVVDEERMEQFLVRHRVRYVGGVDTRLASALRNDLGATGVLVTNLTRYREVGPVQIGLFCRLVTTGDVPEVAWMEGLGAAGDDAPGLLDLGMIKEQDELTGKALDRLARSLLAALAGDKEYSLRPLPSKALHPKTTYNASALLKGKTYSIGVVPFSNESSTPHAGEIVALHFVRHLVGTEGFKVVEPGVVRERLLAMRIIMAQGMSLNDLFLMSNNMGTELFLSGKVARYEDPEVPLGGARSEFSVLLMEAGSKRNVWASRSYNSGSEGVRFFQAGRVGSAFELSSAMAGTVLSLVQRRAEPVAPTREEAATGSVLRLFWEKDGVP